MIRISSENWYISLAKVGILLFIFYESFYVPIFGSNSLIMYGSIIFSFGFVFLDMFKFSQIKILHVGIFFVSLVLYFVYSLIISFFISEDLTTSIDALKTLFGFIVALYCIGYVSEKQHNYDWILDYYLYISIFCALYILAFGGNDAGGRVSLSEGQNVNALGLTMLIGIYATFSNKKLKKDVGFLLKIMITVLFITIIIMTASRKSLICAIIFVLFSFINYFYMARKGNNQFLFFLNCVIVVMTVAIAVYYYTAFKDTVAFERFMGVSEGEDQSTANRINMYKLAKEYWLTSPVVGIGYCQFQVFYGYYSHSTYAEILSCGGIIGCLIFFVPILKNIKTLVSRIFSKKYSMFFYDYSVLLIMLVCELFMGLGQIFIYEYDHLFLLAYIFGSVKMLDDKYLNERNKML